MASKDEKIPLSIVRKLPYKSLNRMIKKMRDYLKKSEVVQKMFQEYDVSIEEIDYIPMMFGNIDVSAKTDHGVIIYNYRLLCDSDFFKDFSYGVHEITHYLQQTAGTKATKSSDDGSYLDNPHEQEGFANQVSYIDKQFGEDEAEKYVDDLLKHHEVDDKEERKDKKETLMSKITASYHSELNEVELYALQKVKSEYGYDCWSAIAEAIESAKATGLYTNRVNWIDFIDPMYYNSVYHGALKEDLLLAIETYKDAYSYKCAR
jgi:hypothetical protein